MDHKGRSSWGCASASVVRGDVSKRILLEHQAIVFFFVVFVWFFDPCNEVRPNTGVRWGVVVVFSLQAWCGWRLY